ncbi:MAG: hypothetical protein HYY28_08350 [Betaproteobacteria bacterium]|nr:hypothetical protein [Betaproteobacteria bacterium]
MGDLAPEGLATLIARGRREAMAPLEAEHWLLERFGVARQRDWPAAPYCLLADGRAAGIAPGEDCWMRADPVHLRAEGSGLLHVDASECAITDEEAGMLARDINRHFAGSFTLVAPRRDRWYLRLQEAPDMETAPLAAVCGRSIASRLPRGAEAMRWQARTNELQMLLHEHPVNAAREARGELTVNSVWLWGAGRLAPPQAKSFRLAAANDPLALGLAQAAGAAAMPLPAGGGAWIESTRGAGSVLLVLDALRPPVCRGDGRAWREQLGALDRDWFGPLALALRRWRIGMVSLYLLGPERTLKVETTGSDLRRFWRRAKPLAAWGS